MPVVGQIMSIEPQEMTLAELAVKSGLPGRTVRFYIARGLLPGPRKPGRGATYGPEHLERLQAIGGLQAKGLTLMEIARQLLGAQTGAASPEPVAWWHYPLADDVTVSVRGDTSPWRLKQIKNCLAQMASSLHRDNGKE
jgi:DNA-binding transcriptional MerR regulator